MLAQRGRNAGGDTTEERSVLYGGGGGGTLPPMDAIDAKIAAAEARTDTKFAELRGDLKDFATKNSVWAATGTAIVSILGVLLAVLAFGGDRFDAGVSVHEAVSSAIAEQHKRDDAQDVKLDQILARLPAQPQDASAATNR